jgi:hypothetical protein
MADNPCLGGLDSIVVETDGRSRTAPFRAASDPAFDCFYVYPTVSDDPASNAPQEPSPEIVRTVRAQAALFQAECRLFVPLYRQITLAGPLTGTFCDPQARDIAEQDVVGAFRTYLAEADEGRPFLLLGHSRGASTLLAMIQAEIDGNARLRSRLVSAMLVGGGPFLAAGSRTRGSLQNIPPCRDVEQTGCLLAYNTYAGPPPEGALFGRSTEGRTTVCTNPASLPGGRGVLTPVVPVPSEPGASDVAGFVRFPDSLVAECLGTPSHTWLSVEPVPGSALPADVLHATPDALWGLHRFDVTLALDDLVRLAARQAAAVGGHARPGTTPAALHDEPGQLLVPLRAAWPVGSGVLL